LNEKSPTRAEGGPPTAQCRFDRSPLRESAVCSRDNAQSSVPRRGE